jgi:hypothetical protein
MAQWEVDLVSRVSDRLREQTKWSAYLESTSRFHLAVLNQPYLGYVLERKKTIETRFSMRRSAPYGAVNEGDILLLKGVGGPVMGISRIVRAESSEVSPEYVDGISSRYSGLICADEEFWKARRRFRYVTLIWVSDTTRLDPIGCGKRDRRGWVVLGTTT